MIFNHVVLALLVDKIVKNVIVKTLVNNARVYNEN